MDIDAARILDIRTPITEQREMRLKVPDEEELCRQPKQKLRPFICVQKVSFLPLHGAPPQLVTRSRYTERNSQKYHVAE
jgi:hypothetical protein